MKRVSLTNVQLVIVVSALQTARRHYLQLAFAYDMSNDPIGANLCRRNAQIARDAEVICQNVLEDES